MFHYTLLRQMITQPPDTWVQMGVIKFATLCNNKYLLFSKVGRSVESD